MWVTRGFVCLPAERLQRVYWMTVTQCGCLFCKCTVARPVKLSEDEQVKGAFD